MPSSVGRHGNQVYLCRKHGDPALISFINNRVTGRGLEKKKREE